MSGDDRPLLAITLGDPAGICPEVVLKALTHTEVYERSRPPSSVTSASWIARRGGSTKRRC